MEVEATEPALVVISQSFYHNWRATVDGKSVPLLRAPVSYTHLDVYKRQFVERANAWKGKHDTDRAMADYDNAVRIDPEGILNGSTRNERSTNCLLYTSRCV